MVTPEHEALHRIFLEDPELFARAIAKILGHKVAVPDTITVLNCDLTETRPVERRVDSVLLAEILVETGTDRYILVIESQTEPEDDKRRRWPYAIAYLHDKYVCDVVLLVVCSKATTARWARNPITIGLPDVTCMTVRAIVFGPDNVPVVTDPAKAGQDVCFAVFSALTHSRSRNVGGILKALAEALGTLDAETGAVLAEFTEAGLGTTAGLTIWRQLMAMKSSYPYVSQMRSQGRTEGRTEGLAEGRLEQERKSILRIFANRGITVSDELRDQINACTDADLLDRWFDMALVVKDSSELLLNA
jgi:hypothetical protein